MSKQVTMTMYAHKAGGPYKGEYVLFNCDMSESGYILLGEVEVSFTPPAVDTKAVELESIDKAITALRADFQGELNALEGRAHDLLSVTHRGADTQ